MHFNCAHAREEVFDMSLLFPNWKNVRSLRLIILDETTCSSGELPVERGEECAPSW
jgi:hypothetical protein